MVLTSRSWDGLRATACVLLIAALQLLVPTDVTGQDAQPELGRFRVLIPDLEALDGADRGFGEDVARELRALMAAMPTHRAIARDEITKTLDALQLDMRELNCLLTRQLAARINAQVALCAQYSETDGGDFVVDAVFWDTSSGESFELDQLRGSRRDGAAAAIQIQKAFDSYTAQVAAAANCEAFAASQIWDRALTNCDRALALNESMVGPRYRRARVLFEVGRAQESLEELNRVLVADPGHEAALQLAGFVAASLGMRNEALEYYRRYLQFSPDHALVRMRVAYDLAKAGDPEGAMLLVQQGIDLEPGNVDLWEQFGGYAFAVADRINREWTDRGDSGGVAPDAEALFREAVAAYWLVYDARGPETAPRHLRSIATAHLRLDEVPLAVSMASEALDLYPEDDGLWSVFADALRRSQRLDDALGALARLDSINPAYPNLGLRRGTWLMEAGRIPEAVEVLRAVALAEPDRADSAVGIVLAHAHARGILEERYAYAIDALSAAAGLPNLTEETRHSLNFWHGYALLQQSIGEQESRTLEVARLTLPKFLRVLELLDAVGDYPATVNVTIERLRDAVAQYIDVQEAIIRRGG